jgi:hypothetical protein
MAHLRRLAKLFDVETMEYDPRFFDVPANMLRLERLPMHEATQSVELMTRAVGATYSVILNGEIHHSDDFEFRSHVLGAKPRYTGNGTGFTLEKLKSTNRIDGGDRLTRCMPRSARAAAQGPRWSASVSGETCLSGRSRPTLRAVIDLGQTPPPTRGSIEWWLRRLNDRLEPSDSAWSRTGGSTIGSWPGTSRSTAGRLLPRPSST